MSWFLTRFARFADKDKVGIGPSLWDAYGCIKPARVNHLLKLVGSDISAQTPYGTRRMSRRYGLAKWGSHE